MEKLPILDYTFACKKHIRLVPISCLHIGHKKHDPKKTSAFLDYIRKTPDTYTIMLGDTVENVISETAARLPGSIHDQVLGVEEQREQAVNLLTPLAKAGKILAWTESNHSLRSWYAAGFSPERWLADQLKVPFCGTDALLHLKVGRQTYVVHATHGTGAGCSIQSVFGKLLAQQQRIEGADVYIRGHHHKKVLADTMSINGKTGEMRKKIIAATGCFMGYIEGYGHRKELPPTVPGCVKIKLYADRWDIHGGL